MTSSRRFDPTREDPNDPLRGWTSANVITQLGRDVAEKIGQELKRASQETQSPLEQRYLVTGRAGLWVLQNTDGTVLSTHRTRSEAREARKAMVAMDSDLQSSLDDLQGDKVSIKGSLTTVDVGGPIMFLRSLYAGSHAFNLGTEDESHYQHTFQPPTTAGGRINYDITMISRYRAYAKRFGMDLEEGWVKTGSTGHEMTAVYNDGGRRQIRVSESFRDTYPNIRTEELTGENYGFVVVSDNGLVTNTVFTTAADAKSHMDGLIATHTVTADGKVRFLQLTLNEAAIETHKKPVNPWMNVNAALDHNDPVLKSMLDQIGQRDKPHLIDRLRTFKQRWKDEMRQGTFDRFHGIKKALIRTGKSERAYKIARLTTGLQGRMRAIMEYGAPVWKNDVMQVEGQGLMKALEPVADSLDLWAAYMAGLRGKELLMEGYDQLTQQDKQILKRASRHFEGDTEQERVFNLLAHVAEQNLTEGDFTGGSMTRRNALKAMGATILGTSSGAMPSGSSLDRHATDVATEFLRKGIPSIGRSHYRHPERLLYGMREELRQRSGEQDVDDALKRAVNRLLKNNRDWRKLSKVQQSGTFKSRLAAVQQHADNDINSVIPQLDMIIEKGREKNFNAAQLKRAAELGQHYPLFDQTRIAYNEWREKLIRFAVEAGSISEEQADLWKEADYIPFYRILDERMSGPFPASFGIVDRRAPTKRLRGGVQNTEDLIHNIFVNATQIMDSAVHTHAAKAVVDELVGTGLMRKIPSAELRGTLIPGSELKKKMIEVGINPDTIAPEVFEQLHNMFGLFPPTGPGIFGVLENGKMQYYFTEDEMLYRAMTGFNVKTFGKMMTVLRSPKRWATFLITVDPGFILRNFIRDSMSVFAISRKGSVPFFDGLRGAVSQIAGSDTMQQMMASGGAFTHGFMEQGDPKSTQRYLKRQLKGFTKSQRNRFLGSILNSPAKLARAYGKVASASENGNRQMVYEKELNDSNNPDALLDAAYEAKHVMDFSKHGDWAAIQFLIQAVPFMNARLQGLDRLAEAGFKTPGAFFLKGAMLMIAGMAVWLRFRDDERYKRLPDWDKDTYIHFWVDGEHFRIPKGFEVGAIFNTMPERALEYVWSQENDAGKHLLRRMGHMFWETFSLNPIPQTMKPVIETLTNKNFFTGNDIESPWEQQRLSKDRYRHYTSPTMIELSAHMPEMETVLSGKITSPLHLQNLYHGYMAGIGRYALMATDAVMRNVAGYPVAPEMELEDFPVISSFYRGTDVIGEQTPKRTRYEQAFYDNLNLITKVAGSLDRADDAGNDPRYDEIEARYEKENEAALDFRNFQREISQINREIRDIWADENMTGRQKRDAIDRLRQQQNDVYEDAYEARPGNEKAEGDDDQVSIDTLIDNFNPGYEVPAELYRMAPQTARLMERIGTMNENQLARLSKAGRKGSDAEVQHQFVAEASDRT